VSVSVIEQARIQAQVLVLLVKALQAELGEARANAILRGTSCATSIAAMAKRSGAPGRRRKNRARPMSARPSRRHSRLTPATTRSITP
jgi:hypothetical protein